MNDAMLILMLSLRMLFAVMAARTSGGDHWLGDVGTVWHCRLLTIRNTSLPRVVVSAGALAPR
jgi:hypothetical protein